MAISSINSRHAQTHTPVQTSAVPQKAPAAKPQPVAADTIKISPTAKNLQEQTAAPSQIVQAADAGDLQAQAQLAKPTAAPAVEK
jgi:hypothetical protein